MTNAEAKATMEKLIYLYRPRGNAPKSWKKAIEALEKQTPKRPIKSDTEIRYCEVWKCPNCGFEWSTRVVDFCYKCGQHIDWSEA